MPVRRTQGPATAAWRTHEGGWAESGPERTANGVREREGGVAASDEADPVEDTEAIVSTPRQDLTRRTMIEAGGSSDSTQRNRLGPHIFVFFSSPCWIFFISIRVYPFNLKMCNSSSIPVSNKIRFPTVPLFIQYTKKKSYDSFLG